MLYACLVMLFPWLVIGKLEVSVWQPRWAAPSQVRNATGLARDVAVAVLEAPFDGGRHAIDPANAMFERSHHQVTDVRSGDAGGGGEEAHGFPIAAVKRERNADHFAVATADLEAARAPVRFRSSAPLLRSGLHGAGVAIEAADLHHPVDRLRLGGFKPAAIACRFGMAAPADSHRSAARRSPP